MGSTCGIFPTRTYPGAQVFTWGEKNQVIRVESLGRTIIAIEYIASRRVEGINRFKKMYIPKGSQDRGQRGWGDKGKI